MESTHPLSLPKLQGKINYREWRFRANLIIRSLKLGKKTSNKELEVNSQAVLVNSMSDKVVSTIMHLNTCDKILGKLDLLYGLKSDDIDNLYIEFQMYKYDNSISLLENVSKLEYLRQQINLLEIGKDDDDEDVTPTPMTDAAFKARLINMLPTRFDSIISSTKLIKNISLKDLIEALDSEDTRLTSRFEKRKENPKKSFALISTPKCFKCGEPGHKSFECKDKKLTQTSSTETTKGSTGNDAIVCKYCKEKCHMVKTCPELEKRKNAVCRNCGEKGHYNKNCKKGSSTSVPVNLACMGLANPAVDKTVWALDSACTAHVCNEKSFFENLSPVNTTLIIGDTEKSVADKYVGTVKAKDNEQDCVFEFRDVMFNPKLFNPKSPVNLVSVFRLLELNCNVKLHTTKTWVLTKNNYELRATINRNNLWVLSNITPILPSVQPCVNVTPSSSSDDGCEVSCLSLSEWHKRFSHQNFEYTRDILKRFEIKYEKLPKDYKCKDCVKGKISRLPFNESDNVATEVGNLTHADLMTSPMLSLGNSKYALCLKDDFSKFRTVYFLKKKDETLECFCDYFLRIETQTGKKPKILRSDNGTKELNDAIDELTSSLGMVHELTCPFTPEQNGRIERDMRTLSEAVGTLLIDSGLGKSFWAEALSCVVYTLNRVSKSSIASKTPYELFYNKEPYDVRRLHKFGSEVVIQVPKQKRKRFDPKGADGVFVGYEEFTKGYKVYLTGKEIVTVSRNVMFLSPTLGDSTTAIPSRTVLEANSENCEAESDDDDEYETIEIDYDWDDTQIALFVSPYEYCVPNTFSDIGSLGNDDRARWMEAIQRELKSMETNEVWKPVTKPDPNVKIIDTKWVFKIKSTELGELAKARLVARGFLADSARQNNYAPVVNIESLRIFLAVVVRYELILKQIDAETAFLNGFLPNRIYIKCPEGYNIGVEFLELFKALYGLPEAPKCWYDYLKEILIKLGFRMSLIECCLFILKLGLKFILVVVYVDDMFIAGNKEEYVDEIIEELHKHFKLNVMSSISSFIGLNIAINKEGLTIDQTEYIHRSAESFQITDMRPANTPMDQKLNLELRNGKNNQSCVKRFQQILGSLNYVMERTRLDVNFAVNALSRMTKEADEELCKYAIRVLHYLWLTSDTKLVYKRDENAPPIEAHCDASWAQESDRKSTTGYVIMVYGCLIQFKTKRQSLVALSSTESEYIALSECCRDVMFVRNLLKEMTCEVGEECVIHCDNQPSMKIAKGEGKMNRTKHVNVKYHFVRSIIDKKLVKLSYVQSNENLADFLTKAVGKPQIARTLEKLGFIYS